MYSTSARRNIFISEIKCRFIDHKTTLSGFCSLFSEITTSSIKDFYELIHIYDKDLIDHNKDVLISELKLWIRKINSLPTIPKNAMEALSICNDMYPNIFKFLQILATLPVSTATAERPFSTLKRIKTYLRNSMSEKRLNGLAMLSIHRDLDCQTDEIIDELAKKKRKLDFII
ncbi:52 kDa repressor of the inhibitor of the protein kinase-like [Rhopalosiphum padi]|uniref:52 kDa repressor of the inhibitor of the protein kinase-like n=1 Tax=Rhopalosiphum padi TaxID=40932 RepID=UPI00298D6ACB|nr:52 kDa repressor of the inhibitor of the protein kinase-like [Rhopalosiphum padi]